MSPPIEHGDPEDGDLVEAAPACEVPDDVSEAVRTLIRWAGDDPDREGLLDTPRRVARAWQRICARLCARTRRCTSAAPSRRSAAMTRSCC